MNETIKVLLERRSIRCYEDKPVAAEDLETILNCGQFAANGGGAQPWHFTVVQNKEWMDKLTEENRKVFLASPSEKMQARGKDPNYGAFYGAPVGIIVSGNSPRATADCANAAENMCLAAWALGLGTCYLGSFKTCYENEAGKALFAEVGIPEGFEPMFGISLGYAKGEPAPRVARKEGVINYYK